LGGRPVAVDQPDGRAVVIVTAGNVQTPAVGVSDRAGHAKVNKDRQRFQLNARIDHTSVCQPPAGLPALGAAGLAFGDAVVEQQRLVPPQKRALDPRNVVTLRFRGRTGGRDGIAGRQHSGRGHGDDREKLAYHSAPHNPPRMSQRRYGRPDDES
jgi:hypothetical protein